MILEIENFGPIRKGEIDLSKKMILFTGYNNSGKTYVSQLIWAICNEKTIIDFIQKEFIRSFDEDMEFNENRDTFEITYNWTETIIEKYTKYIIDVVVGETFFVENNHSIMNHLKLKFKFDFKKIKQAEFSALGKEKDSLVISFLNIENNDYLKSIDKDGATNINILLKQTRGSKLFQLIFCIFKILFDTIENSLFLPSSRVFYPTFYQYIYKYEKDKREEMSSLFRQFFNARNQTNKQKLSEEYEKIRVSYLENYTKPIITFLDKIFDLNISDYKSDFYKEFIYRLSKIMGGDVVIHKTEGIAPIRFHFKMHNNEELQMHHSSSSVNQLLSLYLYFKYWVKLENNFLLIDEPEINLHPENQVELIKLLMDFISISNNKILLTSHSPLITDTINNYILISMAKEKGISNKVLNQIVSEFDIENTLSSKDIGVYFFSGTTIEPYKITRTGVSFSDFIQQSRKIQDMNDTLLDLLMDE